MSPHRRTPFRNHVRLKPRWLRRERPCTSRQQRAHTPSLLIRSSPSTPSARIGQRASFGSKPAQLPPPCRFVLDELITAVKSSSRAGCLCRCAHRCSSVLITCSRAQGMLAGRSLCLVSAASSQHRSPCSRQADSLGLRRSARFGTVTVSNSWQIPSAENKGGIASACTEAPSLRASACTATGSSAYTHPLQRGNTAFGVARNATARVMLMLDSPLLRSVFSTLSQAPSRLLHPPLRSPLRLSISPPFLARGPPCSTPPPCLPL